MDLDFSSRPPVPRYPDHAGAKDPDTGLAAANAIEGSGRAATLRAQVLRIFVRGGRHTADEIADLLGEDILSVRPRVSELFKQHKLMDTGERRRNSRGRTAKVLAIRKGEQS